MPEETLGQRIRAARLKLGLSQEDFAEKAGVHSLSVIRWELDRTIPRDDEVQQVLIELCDLHLEDFKRRKKVQAVSKQEIPSQPIKKQKDIQKEALEQESDPQDLDEYVEVVIPAQKIYKGWREPEGFPVDGPFTHVTVNGQTLRYFNVTGPRPLRIEQDPEKETVYEWHYAGEGPRKLAESMLADYFGETQPTGWASQVDYQALQYADDFKWEFVKHFPVERWEITGEEIYAWLLDIKEYPRIHEK
jgi:transcriptional regulator with XRE-family HTH domain